MQPAAESFGEDVELQRMFASAFVDGYQGRDLVLAPGQRDLIARHHDAGKKVVVVLVSGRPLLVNEELERSSAFVAAWLPGSEGRGIAEVLFGDYGFKGKLGFSWPRSAEQIPINVGDRDYEPLFPYGFGLTY